MPKGRRIWQSALASVFLGLALIISACAAPNQPSDQPSPSSTNAQASPSAAVSSPNSTVALSATQLTVWLPPNFDPNGGSLASSVLQDRLDEFGEQHPQVRVDVRVKAEEGTGGLLDSLLTAQLAAPLALPDLILLPHTQLSAAVASQALHPLAGLSTSLDSDDWYAFAQDMAQVDSASYGIPFAGDALILAYRPTAILQVPADWTGLLESGMELGFAAADSEASFTLTQLSALEAIESPADSELMYSPESLTTVFEFVAAAQEQGAFPFWLSQYETTEQSWQAFSEGRVPMVAAWISRVFDSRNVEVSAAPLPTQNGEPFTLVSGWVWAVSTPDPVRAALAAELAEFLTTPEFIAQWTSAAGLLPPRHSSLAAWTPGEAQALASQIAAPAQALPDEDILDLWGPQLAEAVVELLKGEVTPEEALQQVLTEVGQQ